jgi:hypothetical protein
MGWILLLRRYGEGQKSGIILLRQGYGGQGNQKSGEKQGRRATGRLSDEATTSVIPEINAYCGIIRNPE